MNKDSVDNNILITILPSTFKGIGGAELHWFRLLFALSRRFPNMRIKAIYGVKMKPKYDLFKNIQFISLPLVRLTESSVIVIPFLPIVWFLEFFFMILLLIKDTKKIVALHITMSYPRAIPFIIFSKLLRKIVIMEMHGFVEISRFWKISSKYLRFINIIVATNKIQYLFLKKKRLGHVVIYIPALGSYSCSKTSRGLCKRVEAKNLMHGISMAYFGGEKRVKGFLYLLKLLPFLIRDSRILSLSLFGKYNYKSINLIKKLSKSNPKIRLKGLISHKDVIKEIRKHDIVLGVGFVAHEALSQCRPVVLWYDFDSVYKFDVIGMHYESISNGLAFLPITIKDYNLLLEDIVNFVINFSKRDPKTLTVQINKILYYFDPRYSTRRYYILVKALQRMVH